MQSLRLGCRIDTMVINYNDGNVHIPYIAVATRQEGIIQLSMVPCTHWRLLQQDRHFAEPPKDHRLKLKKVLGFLMARIKHNLLWA